MSLLNLLIIYGSNFGERIVGNLLNYKDFCTSCISCIDCRYGKYDYSKNITSVIRFKSIESFPLFIENPEEHIPKDIPSADIAIIHGIHQDILLELPYKLKDIGIKGLIFPIEDPHDISLGLKKQIETICKGLNIETSFPKPFCSLTSSKGVIKEFIDEFKIGMPIVKIKTMKDIIVRVSVDQSAPCGSTWFVARKLEGVRLNKDEIRGIISEAHHSYPCTASMDRDIELGDTILHKAGYIIREAVEAEFGYKTE
ncbi:MAG: thymidylate synthase [Candidatus Methanoliparum thermophilum]|uniref:Thymidylate synthase n=1 Tax=Methanoliparum thermophilum TaxID=2491083 RepID=A0A520KT41_METT2|nr:MAG: thymidylate synthase [Candidatus Methanoliparum thermophilum]BDC35807.1 thymidylate synthase [Candidatus Methanoliparum sp. LAM-1]